MLSDELSKQLHDCATRGEPLSPEERAQLEVWYAAQDQSETAALGLNGAEATLSLRKQIDGVLAQIAATTKRIQELVAENDTLRREIAILRQQLAERTTLQPA